MARLRIPDWTPELSVGNPHIDAQHRLLVVLGRQVMELLDAPQADSGRFQQLINDIADAMRRHFETEEAVLAVNCCPALAEHRARHDQYIERMAELLFDGSNGDNDQAGLARLIHELVVEHVVEQDLPLKAYMKPSLR